MPTQHIRSLSRLASGLAEVEVDIFLAAVIAMAEPVVTHFLWRPQLRDAGDEMVLEAAVNGRADALVTFNVRISGRHRHGSASNFCCRGRLS